MYNRHLKIVEDSNTITAATQFLLMTKKMNVSLQLLQTLPLSL